MIVGPPYPNMECINRLHDRPLASEENSLCHLPEARVREVQDRAKRSKEEDDGAWKKELVGDLCVVCLYFSTERVGIHNGVTPGGKGGCLPSPGAV
mmetsp:Transcript_109/g.263  ORF Transcript_109/g.263 Transcript_109/m.263 type:complete len:96 (-) Transcript_109:1019-1306(-)